MRRSKLKFERFAALVSSGVPVTQAVELSDVESEAEFALLKLAIQTGAPVVPTALSLARHQENLRAFQREVEQAQAMPRATRKLMLWLPLFGLALGELMGFGPFGALGTTPGLLSFLGAIGLTYVGGSITQRMLERSRDHQVIPGEHWFRLGILLSSGLALSQALEQSKFDQRGSELIELALSTGASLSTLISAQQQIELADYAASQIASAKELAVKLLIPLGLTTLPAFLILTVFPMLIGIGNK